MMETDCRKLQRALAYRHIIVDTNVLIEGLGVEKQESAFEHLFSFLEKHHCTPVLFPLVKFEFFRNFYQEATQRRAEEFLRYFHFVDIPEHFMEGVSLEDATALARLYAARGMHGIGLVDCVLGAMLRQRKKDLLLLTRNHKDFPMTFFERVGTWAIGRERDLIALGFYRAKNGAPC